MHYKLETPQLTVTSRKAQPGTLVPFGTTFENLIQIIRASRKTIRIGDERRYRVGGSAVE